MTLHRRAALGTLTFGLAAAAALGATAATPAAFGAVHLDTGPIAARGLPNYARRVAVGPIRGTPDQHP